jgi:hypothetical protein
LNAYGDDCFTIGADNVTIDFNGYSITGDSNGSDMEYGIGILGYDNVKIINGIVHGFTGGVVAEDTNNLQILGGNYSNNGPQNDDANDNEGYNILISDSSNFIVRDLLINNPTESVGGPSCPFLYTWDGSTFDFQSDLANT